MSVDRHREPARIARVFYGKEDHGILTCQVYMEGDGWGQAFGGLALDERLGPDFIHTLCEAFGVRDPEALRGRECIVLRAFAWDNIEGLEAPSGKRFTITNWRRRHWPDSPNPLERMRSAIKDRIAHMRRRIADEERELLAIDAKYHDYEVGHAG